MTLILDILLSLVGGIIVLSTVVIIHEFGHFYFAKKAGIYCKEFAIGMGPVIWSKQKGETLWSVRLLPIGGYVAMAGETEEDSDIPEDRWYKSKKVSQRFMTVIAGVMMNVILGLFVFLIVGLISGVPNYESNEVHKIVETSPAYLAGLRNEDKITHIEGIEVNDYTDIQQELNKLILLENNKNTIDVTYINSNNESNTTTITPQVSLLNLMFFSDNTSTELKVLDVASKSEEAGLLPGDIITHIEDDGSFIEVNYWYEVIEITKDLNGSAVKLRVNRGGSTQEIAYNDTFKDHVLESQNLPVYMSRIGISPETKFSLFGGIANGFEQTGKSALLIFSTLELLLFEEQIGISDMGGPVAIFQMSGSVLKNGLISLLSFIGLFSINLAVLNLLPIPALDGGRLVFLAYEGITKKKVNERVETILVGVTFMLLMLFFVIVFFNDIIRLFT